MRIAAYIEQAIVTAIHGANVDAGGDESLRFLLLQSVCEDAMACGWRHEMTQTLGLIVMQDTVDFVRRVSNAAGRWRV